MPRKYSVQYIDKLLSGSEYSDLVGLSAAVCSSSQFSLRTADYGLPSAAFVFVETLYWFAQSIRSGTWTYYEATNQDRQKAMHQVLQQFAPDGFVDKYLQGMRDWQGKSLIQVVDDWIKTNDPDAHDWLRSHVRAHLDIFMALAA